MPQHAPGWKPNIAGSSGGRSEFAGLEFANPLAEAVFDRLLQDQSQLSENRSASCATSPSACTGWGHVETTEGQRDLVDLSAASAPPTRWSKDCGSASRSTRTGAGPAAAHPIPQ